MKKQTAIRSIAFFLIVQAAVLSPFVAGAQKDVSGIPIPMKKGIVFYENSYPAAGSTEAAASGGGSAGKDQALYQKALAWFAQTFPEKDGPATRNSAAAKKEAGNKIAGAGDYANTFIDSQSPGSIMRKETFKVLTGDTAVNYYYITVTMQVSIKDGVYALQVYNFYEKPIQKGITNDYSKIEYRWWDFRQGKPWFSTDKALFTGLNEQTVAYIDSFHKEMASL